MKNEYYHKDLLEMGFNNSCLQTWVERGFIGPSIYKTKGQGDPNVWSAEDIGKLFAFKYLIKFGFKRRLASKIINT